MSYPSPRWRKILRDLWMNRTRTLLVVLSLAVGIFTISFLLNAQTLLRTAFEREFRAVNPSSATLFVPEGFDQDLVKRIRRMPEIQNAEGRRVATVRLAVGKNQWLTLALAGIRDFRDMRIDRVQPYEGAWGPGKGAILLERTSLRLATMPDFKVGDAVNIQTTDGRDRSLKLTGIAYDFNRTPSPGTGIVYGYVTLDTLAQLGEPTDLNQLSIVVAQNKSDKEFIERVANRVKAQVEDSGKTVGAMDVPEPGQHPLGTILDALAIAMGTLSVVALVGGALLVTNTIVALLARQVRQIGIMKAIGARGRQIVSMYLVMVLIFGLLSLAIATPLAIVGGVQFARFLGNLFNLDLETVQIPTQVYFVELLIGIAVPLLAALYPIGSSTRVTVREALADYGLSNVQARGAGSRRRIANHPGPIAGVRSAVRYPLSALSRPVLLSLRNTFRRRLRLVLTLLPLVLSGAILLTAVNVRASLVNEMDDVFRYRRYDINVSFERPYRLAAIENTARSVQGVTYAETYRETTDVYRIRSTVGAGSGETGQTKSVLLRGIPPDTDLLKLPVSAGRWLSPQDRDAVVVNDVFLRDEPDIRTGDRVRFKIGGRKVALQIVGVVTEKMAPAGLYVTDTLFSELLGDVGRANRLWVVTDSRAAPENLTRALEAQFEQGDLQVASLKPVSDERGFVEFHFNILIIPLSLAAVILALVGGLGLMGTMSTNVLERRREIGVMRAIGASNGSVQQILLVEGLFIGFLSWLISLVVAVPLTYLLDDMVGNRFLKLPLAFTFSPEGILAWLVIVVLTVILSCYVPARNAAQTQVRELLAYE